MRELIKEIEERIKQLKQQKGTVLTADDVAQMKTVAGNVEQAQWMLKASSGHLSRKVTQLKDSQKSGDRAGVLRDLDEIITIQNKRIKTLEEINTNLNAMKKTLG